jgi:hypothetical protein
MKMRATETCATKTTTMKTGATKTPAVKMFTMKPWAMKGIFLVGSLALGLFAVACGGGNSTFTPTPTPTPTPQGSYSLASLNGTYAFTMSGTDNTRGLSISRIGSFHADGQGNITMAIEDVNDSGSFSTFNFTAAPASKYTMSSDGKGVLTLSHPDAANPSVADIFTFSIVLNSTSSGLLIETDGSSTMSGNFRLQNISSAFATAYAFDFTGVDLGNQTSTSFIGQFTTNGVSGVTGGQMDVDDGASPSGAITLQPGTITLDATNFSNFGRGTLTLNTTLNSRVLNLSYVFYVVDGSHLVLVENDTVAAASGLATAQAAVPTTTQAFPGSFVFAVGGAAISQGVFGGLVRAGRYTADANGNITNLSVDEDFSGGINTFPKSGGFSNVTYTIDAGGSGRGTLNFTDVTRSQTFQYVFYMATPTQGFIQDDSANVVADGSISVQSGTFTAASMAGSYAINWSGVNLANGFEEDFVGVIPVSSAASNNIAGGVVDFTELGDGKIFTGIPMNGMLTLQGDGTLGAAQGNAMQLTTSQTPSTTFNFRAYVVNTNTIILVGEDTGRVVIGTAVRQQ